jgi:antitoxin Phd
MTMLTVSASEARANFSKLGEEIARTGKPVTVFKNSKPWLVMAPAIEKEEKAAKRVEISEAVRIAAEVDAEYFNVFETLAK